MVPPEGVNRLDPSAVEADGMGLPLQLLGPRLAYKSACLVIIRQLQVVRVAVWLQQVLHALRVDVQELELQPRRATRYAALARLSQSCVHRPD